MTTTIHHDWVRVSDASPEFTGRERGYVSLAVLVTDGEHVAIAARLSDPEKTFTPFWVGRDNTKISFTPTHWRYIGDLPA